MRSPWPPAASSSGSPAPGGKGTLPWGRETRGAEEEGSSSEGVCGAAATGGQTPRALDVASPSPSYPQPPRWAWSTGWSMGGGTRRTATGGQRQLGRPIKRTLEQGRGGLRSPLGCPQPPPLEPGRYWPEGDPTPFRAMPPPDQPLVTTRGSGVQRGQHCGHTDCCRIGPQSSRSRAVCGVGAGWDDSHPLQGTQGEARVSREGLTEEAPSPGQLLRGPGTCRLPSAGTQLPIWDVGSLPPGGEGARLEPAT